MRILVISDSHGRNDDIEGVLKQVGDIDMMIHCGDVERGDSYIREIAGCPVVMVAGNNDYYLDLPNEEEIRLGDYKVLVNPGSISYPRQAGRKPTFLIMEIDEEGQAHYAHGYYKEQFDELML